jgi:putative spermidine/putrescine transport system permease protein
MWKKNRFALVALFTPVAIVFIVFFILPMIRLTLESAAGPKGLGLYLEMLTTRRYLETLFYTVALSVAVTGPPPWSSPGSPECSSSGTISLASTCWWPCSPFPLAFPGVVVGFMIILLAGRQGLVGTLTKNGHR